MTPVIDARPLEIYFAPMRPTFEDFCRQHPVCQQASKWRLSIIGTNFTIFAFANLDDAQRAQRVAWEDYEEFLKLIEAERKNPKRNRLG